MEICAIIAARGGSKGVPGKNIRPLLGKPLIAYSIEQAKSCRLIKRVVVSTDSLAIARTARRYRAQVPFRRPRELATDKAGKLEVLKHALGYLMVQENYRPDFVVDLDPTSPLRSVKDIEGCIKLMFKSPCDVVITGSEAKKSPYFNMIELSAGKRARLCKKRSKGGFVCRQDTPVVFEMNASIYVYRAASLMKMRSLWDGVVRLYEMPPERSVDIDREIDFKFVELFMKGKKR